MVQIVFQILFNEAKNGFSKTVSDKTALASPADTCDLKVRFSI